MVAIMMLQIANLWVVKTAGIKVQVCLWPRAVLYEPDAVRQISTLGGRSEEDADLAASPSCGS